MKERQRLERKLSQKVGQCVADFNLISEGDRIMVCSSGGKDSYVLLHILELLRRRAPIRFQLLAVHLDQGIPDHDPVPLQNWLEEQGFDYRVLRENIYPIISQKTAEGETFCMLCSRLRRGVLYNAAQNLGCTKLALGHNLDDTIETLLLNLLFTGSLKAIPAKLKSDDNRNIVIRPLLYVTEDVIQDYSEVMGFPVLSCSLYQQHKQNKRRQIKELLSQFEKIAPGAKDSIMAAMKNVRTSHLLDPRL